MRRPLIGARRDLGYRYLFITIVAFAVTVILIREYLDIAGYPKVGGGTIHIAHMLWGGLLLVVAVILIQLFVGRRALVLSALAAGAGVGLFIDEVGKFITESNDYFFAPAAPIIYGAVLLLVLLLLVVRRDRQPSPAEATHAAVDAIRDLADGRLSAHGRDRAPSSLMLQALPPRPLGCRGTCWRSCARRRPRLDSRRPTGPSVGPRSPGCAGSFLTGSSTCSSGSACC